MAKTTSLNSAEIVSESFRQFLFFPLWWYSRGLWALILGLKNFLLGQLRATGLGIWLKNLLVPMYGQRDIAGVMISFFMRLFQVIVRSLLMLFWVLICAGILIIWLMAPIVIVQQIFFQLIG